MKARFMSLVLMGIVVFACATCQQKAGLSEQDRVAIRKVTDEAVKMAIGPNANWGAYVNLFYTEDARVMVPGASLLQGREAIRTAFGAMGTMQDEKINTVSLEGRGDLACEKGTYINTIIPPGTQAAVTEKGKYLTVWKKQADGTWKAAYDIWNSDLPPAGLVLPTGAAKPDAGPELKRLGLLVGSWKLDGESKGSPFLPAGKISANLDCQWFSGGSQLLCLYNMVYPSGPVQELSVYGYDPEAKAYWNYDMDSTGLSSFGKVVVQESSWTHVWEYKIGGKSVKMRLAFSSMTTNSGAWKNDYSMAGGPWTPLAEGKATKVK
jgi:ketosteroid isomerase-like protein